MEQSTIRMRMDALSYEAQTVLRTLCSNYRGAMRVKAEFRCSIHHGLDKFKQETAKSMREIRRAKLVTSWRITDEYIDEEIDLCYFTVNANLNIQIEDMAELSVNSQTVFFG
ncbi:MAG: hypothetical protein LBU60_00665 [Clostridiales bacterium]|nr:hypothetical protein [Clostridiales bacterium]